jgi:hypothetical protein
MDAYNFLIDRYPSSQQAANADQFVAAVGITPPPFVPPPAPAVAPRTVTVPVDTTRASTAAVDSTRTTTAPPDTTRTKTVQPDSTRAKKAQPDSTRVKPKVRRRNPSDPSAPADTTRAKPGEDG